MRTVLIEELKNVGHDWIDKIVKLGFKRDWVYTELDRRLEYPGNWKQHFSQMNTEQELRKAISELKKIYGRCLKVKERNAGVYQQNIEKIRAVGKLNREALKRKKTFISKLITWLSTYH